MWIKTISILKKLVFKPEKVIKVDNKNFPNRKMCNDLFNKLIVEDFKNYNYSAGSSTVLTTLYSNIEEYTRGMKEVSKLIKLERPITPTWINVTPSLITVDRFLISSDGFYLDIQEAIAEFKKIGLQLCFLMERSDIDTYGIYEHNLRMLTKLFINLRVTLITLIEVSKLSNN